MARPVEVYNILPVHETVADHFALRLPAVRAATEAMLTAGYQLPVSPLMQQQPAARDLVHWLGSWFGFQSDNVRNQHENIVLLLANYQMQAMQGENANADCLQDSTVERLRKKTLKNYTKWCSFLHVKSNLILPEPPRHHLLSRLTRTSRDQRKELLYISLYLLIWGESANLRFMPECLCFIFHHMADELNKLLINTNPSPNHNTNSTPNRDLELGNIQANKPNPVSHGHNGFLLRVVTPLYKILSKEAEASKNVRSTHTSWRNYDDMNEYFWSKRCFKHISWPLQLGSSFFAEGKVGKTGFVEHRTFLNIFRSFDHLWIGYILMLQAMLIIAWNGKGKPWTELIERGSQARLLSIFITWAGLRVLQSLLDAWMHLHLISWETSSIGIRLFLKISAASCWVAIFSVLYLRIWDERHSDHEWSTEANLRIIQMSEAAGVFILPEVMALVFFILPWLRILLETSDWFIFRPLTWWFFPHTFVGRGLREGIADNIKYTLFWLLVLFAKFSFSFFFQITPLIVPTKQLLGLTNVTYVWHLFFHAKNQSIIFVLWSPVILIYFMDTQIWYGVFSAIVGVMVGLFSHLGEIRNVQQFHLRFPFFVSAVGFNLLADWQQRKKEKGWKRMQDFWNRVKLRYGIGTPFNKFEFKCEEASIKFTHIWNTIISVFREEDIISDQELELMEIPTRLWSTEVIQWPIMLLANEVLRALRQAKNTPNTHKERAKLWKKICSNEYRKWAVIECYNSIKHIITEILVKKDCREQTVVQEIFQHMQNSINDGTFANDYKIEELPEIHTCVCRLIDELLKQPSPNKYWNVVNALQSLYKAAYSLPKELKPERAAANVDQGLDGMEYLMFTQAIELPDLSNEVLFKQLKRLQLILTMKESMNNVPKNLDARRRIAFFGNSLFMNIPHAPSVESMLSFSILTPYYNEDVIYSSSQLNKKTEDGISVIFYLQKIYPDEWANFLERMKREHGLREDTLWEAADKGAYKGMQLRLWASYRGQTLARTVRGMMYYHRALEKLAFLDSAGDGQVCRGNRELLRAMSVRRSDETKPLARRRSLSRGSSSGLVHQYGNESACLKFSYVVTCQKYGAQKADKEEQHKADDIFFLMEKNEALRIAYIDAKPTEGSPNNTTYYSVLVKYDRVQNKEVEIYRIQLPGNPIVGEGKPENQNHALIFTRGEGLQTIDMNQENYFEETLKMRNLLQEFSQYYGLRKPQILGVREHIFTGSVSSLAWFMSGQETSFVTLGQRVLANPLKVRMHYGHPDVFDRVWFLTRGGISKASKVINISEDIFAGYNCTLRGGNVTHHEYIQVGKGRDVGLNQIAMFEAKVASGNGEQITSRDVYRLGHRLDFFRMLSFYFTSVGFYVSNFLLVLTIYSFLWGRVFLALSGVENSLRKQADTLGNDAITAALNQQFVVQIGLLAALPMIIENSLEHGLFSALWDFLLMQLQLASVFFTFSMGTRAHYFGRTLLHGGAKYRATGRGFVVKHEIFTEIYKLFARSHFVKALEIMLLLIVYACYGAVSTGTSLYILLTFSSWFLALSWLMAPFLFNPIGFDWLKTVYDFENFLSWIWYDGALAKADQSWEAWWNEEQDHLQKTGLRGKILEIILNVRFFFFQFGMVYHLNIASKNSSILVYLLSWICVIVFLVVYIILTRAAHLYSARQHMYFRAIQAFVTLFIGTILVLLFELSSFSLVDMVVSLLAFIPTGWGLVSIAVVFRPVLEKTNIWPVVVDIARLYEIVMGMAAMVPVAVLSWMPGFQGMQTRLLFNQAFSRGLQISQLLTSKKAD